MDLLLPALFLCQFYWTWQQAAGPCVRACQVHWRFEVGGGIYSDETVGGGDVLKLLVFDKSKPDLHWKKKEAVRSKSI
jgi:hypothetical protein